MNEGYEYVPSINEKSEEVEFEQTKSTLDDLYGFYRSEPGSVDETLA